MTYVLNILKTNYTLTLTANDVVVALSFSAGITSIAAASITDSTAVGRALITAADAATARTTLEIADYATRAAFVTWATGKTPAVGLVINAAGLGYRYIGTGTAISDLPGWVPYWAISPNHWADNTTPGTTSMAAAIQAANTYAGGVIDASLSYPQVVGSVEYLAQTYLVPSGQTITVPRGVINRGLSRSASRINHGGGAVPCFKTDGALSSNTHVEFENLQIYGAGASTTFGINIFGAVRNSRTSNVTIRNCNVNIGGDTCYTVLIEHCDFQDAIADNVQFSGITSALFFENRIDQAGACNVNITGYATAPDVHVKFIGGHYQRAQQAGIRLTDVDSAVIIAPYFEGNNQSSGSYGDIEWLLGARSRGRDLTVLDMFCTSTSGGTNSRMIKASTAGKVTVVGPKTYIGTAPGNYTVGIDLGASIVRCDVMGGRIDATTRIVAASTNTEILDLEGHLDHSGSDGTKTISSNTNMYTKFDSPANRRNELWLMAGGVGSWYIGRGDSDDTIAGDYYIARTSGGGTTPDLQIDDATGTVTLRKASLSDAGLTIYDDADPTKLLAFQISGITTGTTRTLTPPNADATLAALNVVQTFTSSQTFSSSTNTFGTSTGASTNGIGTGATTTGNTKLVNVGTSGASGSTTNVAIGSNVSGALGTTTINSVSVLLGASTTTVNLNGADLFTKSPSPAVISGAATLTNANLQTTCINYTGGAAAVTFPLGSTLDGLFTVTDTSLEFCVINTGAGTATMTGNTGVTIVGVATVSATSSATFVLRRTAASTYIAYRKS